MSKVRCEARANAEKSERERMKEKKKQQRYETQLQIFNPHTQYSHNLYIHTTTIFLNPLPPSSKKGRKKGGKIYIKTRKENVHLALQFRDTSPVPSATTIYRGYYLNFPPRIIIICAQVFIYIHSLEIISLDFFLFLP